MAMGVVKAIYKFKYFIFCRQKSTGKMARAQGKLRENTGNLVSIGAWQPCMRLFVKLDSRFSGIQFHCLCVFRAQKGVIDKLSFAGDSSKGIYRQVRLFEYEKEIVLWQKYSIWGIEAGDIRCRIYWSRL